MLTQEVISVTNDLENIVISKHKKKKTCPVNMWNFLPRDVGREICIFLGDIDMLGYLLRVSKDWVIHGDELIYKDLASKVYKSQTQNVGMNVHKWGSWLEMLINRPRIRTNGFYCLRTSYWKPPCNDAFWEEKKREYIEVSVNCFTVFLPFPGYYSLFSLCFTLIR